MLDIEGVVSIPKACSPEHGHAMLNQLRTGKGQILMPDFHHLLLFTGKLLLNSRRAGRVFHPDLLTLRRSRRHGRGIGRHG